MNWTRPSGVYVSRKLQSAAGAGGLVGHRHFNPGLNHWTKSCPPRGGGTHVQTREPSHRGPDAEGPWCGVGVALTSLTIHELVQAPF